MLHPSNFSLHLDPQHPCPEVSHSLTWKIFIECQRSARTQPPELMTKSFVLFPKSEVSVHHLTLPFSFLRRWQDGLEVFRTQHFLSPASIPDSPCTCLLNKCFLGNFSLTPRFSKYNSLFICGCCLHIQKVMWLMGSQAPLQPESSKVSSTTSTLEGVGEEETHWPWFGDLISGSTSLHFTIIIQKRNYPYLVFGIQEVFRKQSIRMFSLLSAYLLLYILTSWRAKQTNKNARIIFVI